METEMIFIRKTDIMPFSCEPSVSCFTECCHDLDQVLTPYDVLRLKNALNLPSGEFLARYTIRFTGPETGLPMVSLKPVAEKQFACPFLSENGCTVYEDRPASCRTYPLIRMAAKSRQTGRITVQYALIREPHCKGWMDGGKGMPLAEWIEQQGLNTYEEMNDRVLSLIEAVNRLKPKSLTPAMRDLIFTAIYDLDTFRSRQALIEELALPEESVSEEVLLKAAIQWAADQI
ncbi:YkgJ family cysteine cluster protein [Desulfatirhabdium butyrativorans]|uniref:YkgJ family cysteine cluster protein n=1 Tax=Desulfatirhabdium butyrativorans TaxID=340467 RepID=UPI0004165A46|nr:YkgJ family cysteine cluster protein [Desulfatirhabdium butyrativorans]